MATSIEPPTTAKVVLETSKGPLEIELWAKETPLASRNFLQRCAENYYTGTKFHRVLRGFMAQGGAGFRDQATDSFFADEFHSRLKFTGGNQRARGILGCANVAGQKNSNGSQFFITLGSGPQTQALNGKSTVFGRVVGDSIYNLAKIESDGEILEDGETPLYPVEIKGARILVPYFQDLVYPEEKSAAQLQIANGEAAGKSGLVKKRPKKAKVKLSYDDDDQENEDDGDGETSARLAKRRRFKMKSAHEVMNDKSLVLQSAEPVKDVPTSKTETKPKDVFNNLPRQGSTAATPSAKSPSPSPIPTPVSVSEAVVDLIPQSKSRANPKTAQELDQEFELLKSSLKHNSTDTTTGAEKSLPKQSTLSLVEQERDAYLQKQPLRSTYTKKKGKNNDKREAQTLALLSKFTSKLAATTPGSSESKPARSRHTQPSNNNDDKDNGDESHDDEDNDSDDSIDDGDIYSHRFLPEHVESKDDSLITQFTGSKHNDFKYGQDDPEYLLLKKQSTDTKNHRSNIGRRSGPLMSTEKLRVELRKQKLEKLSK